MTDKPGFRTVPADDTAGYPAWWFRPSQFSVVLEPVARLYGMLLRIYLRRRGRRIPAPVICTGSIVMGGVGKSPMVRLIAQEARQQGFRVAIVSRGYGREKYGVIHVKPERHTAKDVGDEALDHAEHFPTFVAKKRIEAAMAALKNGATFIVMDDGLQHPSLHKDVSILMLPDTQAYGNGRTFPAGPLREPFSAIWERVDCCLYENEGDHAIPTLWRGMRGRLESTTPISKERDEIWLNRPVIAFCGIARPQRFFKSLESLGCEIRSRYAFRDHETLSDDTFSQLLCEAQRNDSLLVTTGKDWARLPRESRRHVYAVPYALNIYPYSVVMEIVKLAKLRYLVRDQAALNDWFADEDARATMELEEKTGPNKNPR